MEDKVSIIIPVFKVEKYLDKCIRSVISQSYKNIEIILVDDGSPDNCPELCDAWARIDSRIKVIHKQNGGLASARNAGLEIASGNFIMFIDSDDYIDTNLITDNIIFFNERNVDMVGFGICEIKGNSVGNISMADGIMSSSEAVRHLLLWDGKVRSFAWNKIYKRSIINNLRFNDALRYGEDTPFVFATLAKATKYYQNSKPYYFYVRREDSLIGVEFSENKMLSIKASELIYNECISVWKEYKSFAECSIVYNCMSLIRLLFLTKDWKQRYEKYYFEIVNIMNKYSTIVVLNNFELKRKLRFFAIRYMPFVYGKICIYRESKKHKKC